ncbi:unnamed protein product [Staurois parvus]|uniref:Uncharacterized protein n=1 Tax=Staurois parvus TaxID=386267 RepID=A0ABN9DT79_9NEOB|nr:unnamed protein product [Staurois parvus]
MYTNGQMGAVPKRVAIYKWPPHSLPAVVNSPVPCDLCDHSQISHVVSNDVRK